MTWDCWKCHGNGSLEVKQEEIICPECFGTGSYCTTEKLIADLQAPWVTSRVMELGTAFHGIMEAPHKVGTLERDGNIFVTKNGFEFPLDVINECYKHINPNFPFENKTTKIYDVLGEDIEVVTQVDQLEGLIVNEHKTCWGQFQFDNYNLSCQWKYYLEIFEAELVRYKVFMLSDTNPIKLREIKEFEMHNYYNLKQDNEMLLEGFVDFIHTNQLESLFIKKW